MRIAQCQPLFPRRILTRLEQTISRGGVLRNGPRRTPPELGVFGRVLVVRGVEHCALCTPSMFGRLKDEEGSQRFEAVLQGWRDRGVEVARNCGKRHLAQVRHLRGPRERSPVSTYVVIAL